MTPKPVTTITRFPSAWNGPLNSQPLSQTTLKIDLNDVVAYQCDIDDVSQYATKPNITPSNPPRNFGVATLIGDIVKVNGQPVSGTYVGRNRGVALSPAPNGTANAEAIADVARLALREHMFEILQSDGTPIGSIVSLGLSGGTPPPGESSSEKGNWAIVGGTGAFLGARGTVGGTGGAPRTASMAEDPANRRINGGPAFPFFINVIPMEKPQIVQTPDGPAIIHSSDSTLVSEFRPAARGEKLSLFATGLGPTVPEVDLGLPFPSSPLAAVNSPVVMTVNGEPAEVLGATGYPGAIDGYQVDFRVPSNAAIGPATVQLTVAWIAAPPVTIRIQ